MLGQRSQMMSLPYAAPNNNYAAMAVPPEALFKEIPELIEVSLDVNNLI
jgi:hypothetical protein